MAMKERRFILTGILIIFLFPTHVSGASKPTLPYRGDPVWRLDLRPSGYMQTTERRPRFVPDTRISFLGEDLLLASFWTAKTLGGCDWKKKAAPDRCRLHAVTIDINTGRVRSSHEWLFPFRDAIIYPARQGNFILSTENGLHLCSADFQELGKVTLPARAEIHVSPSGGTLLAEWVTPAGKSRQKETYQEMKALFETDNLKELRRWESDYSLVESITDNVVTVRSRTVVTVRNRTISLPSDKPRILLRRFDEHEWRELIYELKGSYLTRVKLLNDNFLIVKERNLLAMLDVQGGKVFDDTGFQENEYLVGDPVMSANGLRFAIALTTDRSLAVLTQVIVYDATQRSRIFTLAFGNIGLRPNLQVLDAFDISRDGSVLGDTADGFVELYRLPPSNSPRSTP